MYFRDAMKVLFLGLDGHTDVLRRANGLLGEHLSRVQGELYVYQSAVAELRGRLERRETELEQLRIENATLKQIARYGVAGSA